MSSEELLFKSLEECGWAVSDDFVPASLTSSLLQDCHNLWHSGAFHDAHIGKGEAKLLRPDIRGDTILWLDKNNRVGEFSSDTLTREGITAFFAWAETLRAELNRRYYLGLNSEEFHFARYATGKGYTKHIDQHRGTRQRKISLVLYLNTEWAASDGGELVIYSPEDDNNIQQRILPYFGRLVLFRSDLIPHEVLPCFQTRWSLTGWFRADVQSLP